MIEVVAKLRGRSVFLAGETIECHVTFTNISKFRVQDSPSKSSGIKLAWASAQLLCQCSVSESRMVLPKSPLTSAEVTTTGNETSFIPSKGEKGSPVLSTMPSILFCDLNLLPGESKTYLYQEKIPLEAPPSFRGTAIKYSYKLTIGAHRFDCPTRLLRVPFRVLVVPGLHDLSVYEEPIGTEGLKPSNPFVENVENRSSMLEVALEVLQTMTCRKGPNFYNITNSGGKVARFCLFKQAYRIGDDIVGTCDFSEATVPCVQFSVTLQSEEQIDELCRKKPSHGTTVTSYSKHCEFCLHTRKTHISVPIPLTATPGFNTDLVCLRWRLHFEFMTTKSTLPKLEPHTDSDIPDCNGAFWQAPSNLDVETTVWDLPIKIFATNPLSATAVSLLKNQNSCLV